MATEEDTREAADRKEVQMETVESEPFHMQTHMDSKFSSMEIENMGEIIDSTEGTSKIPEDQVLVEAPSEIKLLDHNLNGTASSLNGHIDKENKISNEQLHEDSKKDHEQIEAASDEESTDQNNKINKEANECFSHGETTKEDSSLSKNEKEEEPEGYDQQDEGPIPDTLKTDSDIDQSQLPVDQLDHNMDPEKATEDTQPASMANIPNAEVVTEACAGVQSPVHANQDDSDSILDTVDGSTEKDEESFPENTSTNKHTEEVFEAEDQQSKQADARDADAVQEDIPRCEETGVSEEIPNSEHADESIIDAQEELHQETSEDTNGPAYGETEQTSQQSSMAASDDAAAEEPKGDDQLDEDPMPDTLKIDSDIDQSQLPVDQLYHNMDPEKATEDTQSANVANIPNAEVLTEPCAGLQSPLDASQDDSDAILDTVHGSTEKDEAAREDGAIHLERREIFPEDTSTAKHIEEVVKAEDQQSKQAHATDADAVQEDISGCKETDVPEETPKTDHADESIIDAQEELYQEPSEDTNGPAYRKKEQTSQQSSMAASDDTNSESKGDDQLDQNTDPQKATEDTQPASMANIPNTVVVTETCAGVQSSLNANLDDSDAIQDTVDGNTEKDEAAREDGAIHRESFPEDTSTAKHTEEVVKAEDQQSKQADATDADAVQEDITKCKETGVSEEIPKSEHADGSIIDAQEELHQETSEDTNGPAYGKKEQTSQQSSIAASDDTASEHDSTNCEPPVDIQVQNKELLEEMKDAEAVDTEAAMQQSCVTFEETIHVPTTEQHSVETNSTESAETHNVKTVPISEEDKAESTERGPTSTNQEVDNVGSTEEIMDNIAESIGVTNVATVDEANKEKNMLRAEDIAEKHIWGIESEVSKSTEPVETEENSDQRYVSLLDDSAQDGNIPVSEKHQMGSTLEINEIEGTRTEAIPEESSASVSEEPSSEDYVIESGTTCDIKEVHTTDSLEAIESDKDTKSREISSQSNMNSAEKSTEESNAPESEPTSEIQTEQEPESEEIKDTELAQENKSSTEIYVTVFHEQTQENNPTRSKLHVMESEGGVSNIEATEVQAAPHCDHPEEKATEETITSSEPQTQETESVEKTNDIEAIKPQNISQKSIISPSEESVSDEIAKEDIVTIEQDDCHHQPQDPEIVDLDTIETNKSQEIASSGIVSNYEDSTSEKNVTVTEPNPETQAESLRSAEVMKDTENVKGHGALAGEAAQEENVETEAIVDMSPVQEPELEEGKNTEQVGTQNNITPSDLPAERMEIETAEIEAIPFESPVASIREVTGNDILTAITPRADIQPVLKQESVEDKYNDTTEKPRETQQVIYSASDELIPTEDNTAMAEPACETQLHNVVTQGIKDSEDAQTDQFSNLDSFPTPGEAAEESKSPRIETTSDVQEVQELDSTEETRGIVAAENEDHQQHRVSTLEEPAVDNKPNVDDHKVHDEETGELKDNETMETEQQLESSRDSEDCKLLKEEETSDQKIITLEDTATEDIVADEIDPPVGMEQEHEQKSVEEVKDITADQAKEDFHTSQPDASNKQASESNVATTEPTYVQHLNDFETNETKSIEVIDDGDISCKQTEIATSVDSSPADNEIAPQEHPVQSHEKNLGNETENAILAHGIKDKIQTTVEQKDDAFDLDETIPTAKKISTADEDVTQSFGEDTLESSNSTDQIKEGQKAGIEHNASQKLSECHGENITHVQDKDINGETVTERGTTESQASVENDAQASQDVTEKDETIKSGEQTNDHRQSGDVEHQPQTCKSSVDDESVKKVHLDEQHKEDEEAESQKEHLQADEQKHEDESDGISNEPLVESKNTENGTTNRTEETDTLEAGQTEAVVKEILKIEQALHTSEDSTASITDTTVEDITGTDKEVEEENRPNSANTSNADAKMDNQENQENTGKDNIVPMDYTGGQDETTDEITNEEFEPGLASPVEDISYTAPSKDHILENDPIAVPYNAESGGFEDKECTNNLFAIQESEKEEVAGMQENKEMQNEAKVVQHAELYNVDTKTDDTTQNTTGQPRDIEEVGANKGLSSIDKPVEETSEQNNVEQHLSIHHKVEDERLESTEDNAVELEATQQKVDTSNVGTNNDGGLSISNSLTKHESESVDDVLQLETEGNTFNKADETVSYEKTEASNTSVPETVTFNEEICDKVAGADGGLSDGSLKTFDDTQRNLDVSSAVTASNEESMNEEMEEHKLAVPAHLTMDENTAQEISVSEKPLPTKPEEQDDQIHKEHDEEDIRKPEFSDDQKEVEQDLPVSNFLMNLILGKENSDANGHSEPETETKQEEIRDDNICLVIPNEEESLALPPTENNAEDKLAVEQEKKDVKCSEETHKVVEEQSHDLKLGTETSLETDAGPNKNSHHLELPPYQDKMQDEVYNEILSEKEAEVTKMEAKDIEIPNTEQEDREVDTPCQENTEPATQNENGSLENNLDDLNNTKTSEEDTLGEGQRGLLPECLNDARSVNSVSEQTLLLTESGMIDAKSLSSEADSVQNPFCEKQDKTNESSNIGATSIPDIQVESNEDKTEEKQPETTATAHAEEHVEISNDNLQKSIGHEATPSDQESQIAEQVSDTEIALGQEKENSEGSSSTFMDKKEDSDVSVKGGSNIQTAAEIEAGDSNMHINQDKQEAADKKLRYSQKN